MTISSSKLAIQCCVYSLAGCVREGTREAWRRLRCRACGGGMGSLTARMVDLGVRTESDRSLRARGLIHAWGGRGGRMYERRGLGRCGIHCEI